MGLVSYESFGVSSYVSAPTSPGRVILSNGVYFYSEPTSPTLFDLELEPETDGFEFRTNQQQQQQKQHQQKEEQICGEDPSAKSMAFADELFCDGKVLPMKHPSHAEDEAHSQMPPLKFPPRLQQAERGKFSNRSSSNASSPRSSPSSLLRRPFLCWSLRNEDFDPFMVALQHVTGERDKEAVTSTQNRTTTPHQPVQHQVLISREPTEIVRLVGHSRSSHGGSNTATFRTFSASTEMNRSESIGQFIGGSHHKVSAKRRIKNFLFNSFEGWVSKKEKLRKSNYFGRFSFRSMYAAHYTAKKGAYEEL